MNGRSKGGLLHDESNWVTHLGGVYTNVNRPVAA